MGFRAEGHSVNGARRQPGAEEKGQVLCCEEAVPNKKAIMQRCGLSNVLLQSLVLGDSQ